MGTEQTHYVVYGVAITDKQEVKKFFGLSEEFFTFFDDHHDNPYQDEITPTKNGLHIILDGMNGKYVVVGLILDKGTEAAGLSFNEITDPFEENSKEATDFVKGIREIDTKLGTQFLSQQMKHIVFTHWT